MRQFRFVAILTVTSITGFMHRPTHPPVASITLAVINARIWT